MQVVVEAALADLCRKRCPLHAHRAGNVIPQTNDPVFAYKPLQHRGLPDRRLCAQTQFAIVLLCRIPDRNMLSRYGLKWNGTPGKIARECRALRAVWQRRGTSSEVHLKSSSEDVTDSANGTDESVAALKFRSEVADMYVKKAVVGR